MKQNWIGAPASRAVGPEPLIRAPGFLIPVSSSSHHPVLCSGSPVMHGSRNNRVPGLGLQRILALARPGGALETAPSTAASGERRRPGLGRRRRAAAVGGSPRAALAELAPGYPVGNWHGTTLRGGAH